MEEASKYSLSHGFFCLKLKSCYNLIFFFLFVVSDHIFMHSHICMNLSSCPLHLNVEALFANVGSEEL